MKIGKQEISLLHLLLVFVPVAFLLHLAHAEGTWVFIASGLAIIPLAGILGEATEHLAEHVGPGIGGLLNATFGNAAELIIAIFALQSGLYGVVKASITGSIIGNLLLVLGASMVAGGLKVKIQSFNAMAAGMSSTLLLLSTAGLVVPALFYYLLTVHEVPADRITQMDLDVSLDVAIVLFVTYVLSLVFSLQTHKHLYDATDNEHEGGAELRQQPVAGRGAEGMEVATSTPEIEGFRKLVLELILSDHPNDCMTCEATGSCALSADV